MPPIEVHAGHLVDTTRTTTFASLFRPELASRESLGLAAGATYDVGALRASKTDYGQLQRPAVEASDAALELAGRAKRDNLSAALALSMIMSHTGASYDAALDALGRAKPADSDAPPAPTQTRAQERAIALLTTTRRHPHEVTCQLRREGFSASFDEIVTLASRIDRKTGRPLALRRPAGFVGGEGQPVTLTLDAGTDDAPKAVWIQLAKPGTFVKGGRRFRLDRSCFEQMVANFRANKDGRLPIDFEHASEQPPSEGSIPQGGAPAQGWIVDLSIRDDGLYAKVEWGALARQYIREGKYRYISPALHLQMQDRETGEEVGAYLSSAGLTNQPFLDGMQPLQARATPASEGMSALTKRLMIERGLGFREAESQAMGMIRRETDGR
jgi:hypothetical protein